MGLSKEPAGHKPWKGGSLDRPDFTTVMLAVATIILLLVVLGLRRIVARRLGDRVIRDPETGAYTSDFIQEVYQSELRRADRTGVPFSLALVVPHPPENAPGGYSAAVTKWLTDHLRGSDYIGRLEDGRFVAILPETWDDDALTLVQRLNFAFKNRQLAEAWLTADIGIATWRPEAPDVWREAEKQLKPFPIMPAAAQN
jgi:GGDEF domain-containing protein